MQSTHRPLIPAVWESFRFVCTQALTERASEKAPARKMQPKKVTSSKSLSLQTSNYSVNVDQWKVKRTEGRSKRGKEHLVRSLHENPNKPGNKQTNKQTQNVYPIASKALFYIKEAENKRAKAERWVAWKFFLRTEKLGKLLPCENVRVDFLPKFKLLEWFRPQNYKIYPEKLKGYSLCLP